VHGWLLAESSIYSMAGIVLFSALNLLEPRSRMSKLVVLILLTPASIPSPAAELKSGIYTVDQNGKNLQLVGDL
tara:strand:+ start:299 stop:520 length:222 start_codon:yes stop_codon:yes gene_type:complete